MNFLCEVVGEVDLEVLLAHLHACEAELELDVFVVDVDQVFNGLVDDVQGRFHHVHAHLAGTCHWHWVRVDHLEALLEDGLLAACGRNLLLTLVTVEVLLEDGVNDEAGPAFKLQHTSSGETRMKRLP